MGKKEKFIKKMLRQCEILFLLIMLRRKVKKAIKKLSVSFMMMNLPFQ